MIFAIFVPHHGHVLKHLSHNCDVVTRPISWEPGTTERDTEVDTEGGLGGHCSAVKDGVLLEKRESEERSDGVRTFFSPVNRGKRKKGKARKRSEALFFFF